MARWLGTGLGIIAAGGTLLSLRRSPHWIFRTWDFPRLQLAGSAMAAAGLFGASRGIRTPGEVGFLGALGGVLLLQARKIIVYTPLWPVQVQRSDGSSGRAGRVRLLVSNVLRENSCFHRLLALIGEQRPDLILALEIDQRWASALEPLAEEYPYVVRKPQANHYGMMLFSRLPLENTRLDFLVQDDVPSIHTDVVLRNGKRIRLHGLHPRPPEPHHDQNSTPRDAELVMVGREIGGDPEQRPTIVAGDLNDVAWSRTSLLFLRLSGLLDPRRGRGFYNSFHARHPLLRWPLDHIFHSAHFRLVELRRLDDIGSDHFPILAELSLESAATEAQDSLDRDAGDAEQGSRRIRRQAEGAEPGDNRAG